MAIEPGCTVFGNSVCIAVSHATNTDRQSEVHSHSYKTCSYALTSVIRNSLNEELGTNDRIRTPLPKLHANTSTLITLEVLIVDQCIAERRLNRVVPIVLYSACARVCVKIVYSCRCPSSPSHFLQLPLCVPKPVHLIDSATSSLCDLRVLTVFLFLSMAVQPFFLSVCFRWLVSHARTIVPSVFQYWIRYVNSRSSLCQPTENYKRI